MDAMNALLSRASVTAWSDPGPNDAELRKIVAAAVRAPDHGKLRPWRFYIVRGEARQRLSEMFVSSLLRRDPAATPAQIEKERAKPLRSPVTIAVAARVERNHKIPEIEQVVSAGAAAMNILNATHALGFGAKWVTGDNCYDAEFRAAFGLQPNDQHLGFIHIGSTHAADAARPDPSEFVTEW